MAERGGTKAEGSITFDQRTGSEAGKVRLKRKCVFAE